MCGILAAYSHDLEFLIMIATKSMSYLRHRGPEAVGIMGVDTYQGNMQNDKYVLDPGKRRDDPDSVINEMNFIRGLQKILRDQGATLILVQSKYITSKRTSNKTRIYANTQPIHMKWGRYQTFESLGQCAAVHNGNIRPSMLEHVKKEIEKHIPINPFSSATVDSRYLTELYHVLVWKSDGDYFEAARKLIESVRGTFSFIYTDGSATVAFKDRWVDRPLCLGRSGDSKVIVSESGFFDEMPGLRFDRELQQGEVVVIDKEGRESSKVFSHINNRRCVCPVEEVYLKDPKSRIFSGNMLVGDFRRQIGREIARTYADELSNADLIIGIPNSGVFYGIGMHEETGIPLDPYTRKLSEDRNFLLFKQHEDFSQIILEESVRGKEVAETDDSIFRLRTSPRYVYETLRKGATSVRLFIAWPPVFFGCPNGIDTRQHQELALYKMIEQKILDFIPGKPLAYSIKEVNRFITGLFREQVTGIGHALKASVDTSKIMVYYLPLENFRKHLPYDGSHCETCTLGVDQIAPIQIQLPK